MLIGAALLFAQLVAGQGTIGLALTDGQGEACVAMSAKPGSVVTLVAADTPKSTITAVVEGPSTSCALSKHTVEGPYSRLRLRGQAPEFRTAWVAFLGEPPSKTVQVHECLSSEGVHYTVWAGEPFKSRRLWHDYYYLGYDVEPSCKQRSEVED
jgi:hypothetical protein